MFRTLLLSLCACVAPQKPDVTQLALGNGYYYVDSIGDVPFEPLVASDAQCLALSREDDYMYAVRAAGTLVLRGRHAEAGLEALLDMSEARWDRRYERLVRTDVLTIGKVWDWALEFAGDGVDSFLARRLAAADDDGERGFLLQQIARVNPEFLHATVDELGVIARRLNVTGEMALLELLRVAGIRLKYDRQPASDHTFHGWWVTDPIADAHTEAVLAEVLAKRLKQIGCCYSASELHRVHKAGVASQAVRDSCRPYLEEAFLDGDLYDGVLLCMLGHFDSELNEVRSAYIEAWKTHDSDDYGSLPCRRKHDEETLAAFRRIFDRAKSKASLFDRLLFMGETDARSSELASIALGTFEFGGHHLTRDGFRGLLPIHESDSSTTRINKLSVTIKTLQEEGHDYAEAESALSTVLAEPFSWNGGGWHDFHAWGFRHAKDLNLKSESLIKSALAIHRVQGYWGDKGLATYNFLETVELSPDDLLHWIGIGDTDEIFYTNYAHYDWETREGELKTANPSSLQDREADAFRRFLRQGEYSILGRLLADGKYAAEDEPYLCSAIARSGPHDRQWALELINHFRLDSPKLRALVRLRTEDADSFVRAAAGRILDTRDW